MRISGRRVSVSQSLQIGQSLVSCMTNSAKFKCSSSPSSASFPCSSFSSPFVCSESVLSCKRIWSSFVVSLNFLQHFGCLVLAQSQPSYFLTGANIHLVDIHSHEDNIRSLYEYFIKLFLFFTHSIIQAHTLRIR
jgi:hypothetical protein